MNESALKVIAELYPIHGTELWRFVQWSKDKESWEVCQSRYEVDVNDVFDYRVKPRTHTVNGIECPAPLDQQPEAGQRVYYINSASPRGVSTTEYFGESETSKRIFLTGCWLDDKEAIENFVAHFPHMREGAGDE